MRPIIAISAAPKMWFLLVCAFSLSPLTAPASQTMQQAGWSESDVLLAGHPTNTLCGVTSVYTVMRELGMDASYKDVLTRMPPGIYGNTMRQIVDYFRDKRTLNVTAVRCSAAELYRRLNGAKGLRAIINLDEHWVVVRNAADETFEIVDFPRKYFMPVDAVDSLWERYAIVIRRGSSLSVTGSLVPGFLVLFLIATVTIALRRRISVKPMR